ncbi:MAG TPA: N-acetyl-gamma-glutamyl-phosphate reductase [Mycobacteriales bacterium]|nr:N-acetyl-gamma-glutamyl-phosphate reductase [Mycobacteriales bacterium]
MGVIAGIVGASGYAGGELVRLVAAHPELELGPLVAGTKAGRPLGEVHPNLVSHADRLLVDLAAPEVADCDLLFLALPHGASAAAVANLDGDPLIVDLGADFRLVDPAAWERWYDGPHAGCWPYGLPELPGARDAIRSARRVANPGCYATAIALALAPLLAEPVVEASDIVVVAASGTSGAGRSASERLLGSEVMGDLTPYKVGGSHQHLGELRQSLSAVAGETVSMSFTPVLAPMPRGILATCTARLRPGMTLEALRAAYQRYDDEPFVTLLPDGQWPHTAATSGSNSAVLQVALDEDAGRAVVVAAIDNLGKGAAGQAVQNANLMLGLPETTGLAVNGVAP